MVAVVPGYGLGQRQRQRTGKRCRQCIAPNAAARVRDKTVRRYRQSTGPFHGCTGGSESGCKGRRQGMGRGSSLG